MKKLNALAILFSLGLLVSCSTTEIADEIGLENDLELESEEMGKVPRLRPLTPLPMPCYTCFKL